MQITFDAADPRALSEFWAQALGATVLDHRDALGVAWAVLTDPEGNEFCV